MMNNNYEITDSYFYNPYEEEVQSDILDIDVVCHKCNINACTVYCEVPSFLSEEDAEDRLNNYLRKHYYNDTKATCDDCFDEMDDCLDIWFGELSNSPASPIDLFEPEDTEEITYEEYMEDIWQEQYYAEKYNDTKGGEKNV